MFITVSTHKKCPCCVPEHHNFITTKAHPVTSALFKDTIKGTFCACSTHIHINIPEELVVGTIHMQNQQEKQ
jgi:hypothetical protein